MSLQVNDAANKLELAIRQSEEFTRLQTLFQEVYSDDSTRIMFEGFRDIQVTLQNKQMMGEEITQEELEQAQSTIALVQQNQKIADLMEAEQQMSVVIADLNQIIMKPLEELYATTEQQ